MLLQLLVKGHCKEASETKQTINNERDLPQTSKRNFETATRKVKM
tara:strand:+ start:481 stop:615 length:135 start_codon:yes stop_codon:yes gene_type:complete